MDLTLMREAVTVVSFITFIGIIVYALAPANRKRFDRAAWMAVDDEQVLATVAGLPSAQPVALESPPAGGPQGEDASQGRGFAN